MFKKVKKSLNKGQRTINPKDYYDEYKVAIVIDGVIESCIEVNLANFCALMSSPTFLNANLKNYKIGDTV
jgi:hypothetical protein